MKVLMIEFFYPYNTYTLELGEELCRHVDLTMVCRAGAPIPRDGIHWKGLLYEGGYGKLKALLKYGQSLLRLCREMRTGHYDIIHVQFFRKARIEMPLYRHFAKKHGRLFYTVHDVLPHEAVEADRALFGSFYRACDGLIVHNEESRRQLVEDFHLPSEKIFTMPMGAYKAPAPQGRASDRRDRVEFLQFGQIRKYKGIDLVIKALALIPPQARRQLHVSVVGKQYASMDNTDYVAMAQSLGVSDCIDFRREHIPDSDIPAAFYQADICLVPYRELYGSASLMMAYSYGKPVIATDLPILREETDGGKTGILFENENPQALADAMLRALAWTNEEYSAAQTEIDRLVNERYNWARSAEKLYRGYVCISRGEADGEQ